MSPKEQSQPGNEQRIETDRGTFIFRQTEDGETRIYKEVIGDDETLKEVPQTMAGLDFALQNPQQKGRFSTEKLTNFILGRYKK